MKKLKIVSLLLAILMIASIVPAAVITVSAEQAVITPSTDWYGDGSASSFTLATEADLLGFAKLLANKVDFSKKTVNLAENKTYTLNSDINNPVNVWFPNAAPSVDLDNGPRFRGTFNGNGSTIVGIYCDGFYQKTTSTAKTTSFLGIFGIPAAGSKVNGVTFKNCKVTAGALLFNYLNAAGTLTVSNVTFDNCFTNGGALVCSSSQLGNATTTKVLIQNVTVKNQTGNWVVMGANTANVEVDNLTIQDSTRLCPNTVDGDGKNTSGTKGLLMNTNSANLTFKTGVTVTNSYLTTASGTNNNTSGLLIGSNPSAGTININCPIVISNSGCTVGTGGTKGMLVGLNQGKLLMDETTASLTATNVTIYASGGHGGVVGQTNTAKTATTKLCNLVLKNVDVSGGADTGLVIGHTSSPLTVKNVYIDSDSSIIGSGAKTGGILGSCDTDGTVVIDNVYYGGNVQMNNAGANWYQMGGFIGTDTTTAADGVTITNSVFAGRMILGSTTHQGTGGLIGDAINSSKIVIQNSAFYGTIEKGGKWTHGTIIGRSGVSSAMTSSVSVDHVISVGKWVDTGITEYKNLFGQPCCHTGANAVATFSFTDIIYTEALNTNGNNLYSPNVKTGDGRTFTITTKAVSQVEEGALNGAYATDLLTSKGFTAWTASNGYLPLPTSLKTFMDSKTVTGKTSTATVGTKNAPATLPAQDSPRATETGSAGENIDNGHGIIPAEYAGKAYTTTPIVDFSTVAPATVVTDRYATVSSYGLLGGGFSGNGHGGSKTPTLASNVALGNDAVGIMIRLKVGPYALVYHPVVQTTAGNFQYGSSINSQQAAHFYTSTNGTSWTANSLKAQDFNPGIAANFDGYLFVPFNSMLKNDTTSLDDVIADGASITGFQFYARYDANNQQQYSAASYVIKGIDLVKVNLGEMTDVSVTLGSDLSVNTYVSAPDFTAEDIVMTAEFMEETTTLTATTISDGNFKYTFKGVLPQQVNEDVTFTLKIKDHLVETYTISVEDYCKSILAGDFSVATKRVVVDLLNYCAAVQALCPDFEGTLANAGLDETDRQRSSGYGETADDIIMNTERDPKPSATTPANWTGASVVLDNAIALKIATSYTGTATIAVDGEARGTVDVVSGTILFKNIGADEFSKAITITINDDTLTYRVNNYLVSVLKSEEDIAVKNAAQALYYYGVSARFYASSLIEED